MLSDSKKRRGIFNKSWFERKICLRQPKTAELSNSFRGRHGKGHCLALLKRNIYVKPITGHEILSLFRIKVALALALSTTSLLLPPCPSHDQDGMYHYSYQQDDAGLNAVPDA
ncbi:hypothetical protein MTR_1g073310 [Medicago truncatula]|uniref:Uncharacterized protein n=1 Tax=Medicago truncatula TaxID=3880 RepID=G7I2Q8_MEDTR|nr:hypothetical protein MTR_1g073310 [Medicago truncatula]